MKKILIFSLFLANTSYADCKDPVKYLQKGSPAPCTGYLFSPEQESFVRKKIEDHALLEKIVDKQDDLIKELEKRSSYLQESNDNLNKKLNSKDRWSTLEQIIYFALGAIIGFSAGKSL